MTFRWRLRQGGFPVAGSSHRRSRQLALNPPSTTLRAPVKVDFRGPSDHASACDERPARSVVAGAPRCRLRKWSTRPSPMPATGCPSTRLVSQVYRPPALAPVNPPCACPAVPCNVRRRQTAHQHPVPIVARQICQPHPWSQPLARRGNAHCSAGVVSLRSSEQPSR